MELRYIGYMLLHTYTAGLLHMHTVPRTHIQCHVRGLAGWAEASGHWGGRPTAWVGQPLAACPGARVV